MSYLSTLRNLVTEVVIETNPPYVSYLTLDRIFDVIAKALKEAERDENGGNIRYNYVSRVKGTSPHRTLIIEQPQPVPNRPYYVRDVGHRSMTGLVTVTIPNFYRFEEQPKLKRDKRTGMMWEEIEPMGWD